MITFIRHLVAVPLKLLLWVCGFVPLFDKLSLMEKIFFLTGDANDGNMVIYLTGQKEGIDAARAKAEKMLERCPSAKISYAIAVLEMNNNPDCVAAVKWVDAAWDNELADGHVLYVLQLYFSYALDNYDREAIVDKMLACNYLPVDHTHRAMTEKMDILLEKQQWADAEEIADKMLSIRGDAGASIAKWIVCLARQDERQANEHLAVAGSKLTEDMFHLQVGQGYLYLGDRARAMEALHKAVKAGLKWRERKSLVGQMLGSDEFRNYCLERG